MLTIYFCSAMALATFTPCHEASSAFFELSLDGEIEESGGGV